MRLSVAWMVGLLLVGCERRPSATILKSFPNRVQYEKLHDVEDGVCVVVLEGAAPNEGGRIIIPGDVVVCETNGEYIVGRKVAAKRPAPWMDSNWAKEGFFILDPRRINLQGISDEDMFGSSVNWFTNQVDFTNAIYRGRVH